MELLIPIAAGILSAVISAFLATALALRRFQAEKRWEARFAASKAVIEALHTAARVARADYEHFLEDKERSKEEGAEQSAAAKLAHTEIMRAIDVGDLVLSAEAVAVLERYVKQVEHLNSDQIDIVTYIDHWIDLVIEAQRDFRKIARKDLDGIARSWWSR